MLLLLIVGVSGIAHPRLDFYFTCSIVMLPFLSADRSRLPAFILCCPGLRLAYLVLRSRPRSLEANSRTSAGVLLLSLMARSSPLQSVFWPRAETVWTYL